MTLFDLFVLAIVGASVAAGALRGFVRALIASVGLVVGFFVASHTYAQAGSFIRGLGFVESIEAGYAAGFLLMVGVVLAVGSLRAGALAALLRQAVRARLPRNARLGQASARAAAPARDGCRHDRPLPRSLQAPDGKAAVGC